MYFVVVTLHMVLLASVSMVDIANADGWKTYNVWHACLAWVHCTEVQCCSSKKHVSTQVCIGQFVIFVCHIDFRMKKRSTLALREKEWIPLSMECSTWAIRTAGRSTVCLRFYELCWYTLPSLNVCSLCCTCTLYSRLVILLTGDCCPTDACTYAEMIPRAFRSTTTNLSLPVALLQRFVQILNWYLFTKIMGLFATVSVLGCAIILYY